MKDQLSSLETKVLKIYNNVKSVHLHVNWNVHVTIRRKIVYMLMHFLLLWPQVTNMRAIIKELEEEVS